MMYAIDGNLVAPLIALTLDVREAGDRSVLENLHGYLRAKLSLPVYVRRSVSSRAAPLAQPEWS